MLERLWRGAAGSQPRFAPQQHHDAADVWAQGACECQRCTHTSLRRPKRTLAGPGYLAALAAAHPPELPRATSSPRSTLAAPAPPALVLTPRLLLRGLYPTSAAPNAPPAALNRSPRPSPRPYARVGRSVLATCQHVWRGREGVRWVLKPVAQGKVRHAVVARTCLCAKGGWAQATSTGPAPAGRARRGNAHRASGEST